MANTKAKKILTDKDDNYTDLPFSDTIIVGLAGNDIINGEDGNDVIYGGAGNDTISDGTGSDIVYGGSGNDRFRINLSKLDTDIDKFFGGEGNDEFSFEFGFASGTFPNSFLYGGAGDDTYILNGFDHNSTFDDLRIIEKAGEGIDTIVVYRGGLTLPSNVENLELPRGGKGYGNSLDNLMFGNADATQELHGGAGNDTLLGGIFRRSDSLFGDAGNDRLNGFLGNDTLDGGTGDDILEGFYSPVNAPIWSSDIDLLIGGQGNDIYYSDNSDTIIENAKEGIDTRFAAPRSDLSTDFSLADNVENLTIMDPDYLLTGTERFNGFGNDLSNRIEGNRYDNSLFGYKGSDRLIGGDGNDVLDGGLGIDRYDGGAGDDQLLYDPVDFKSNAGENQYVGGAGTDTLIIPATSPNLDLTTIPDDMIRGIDIIKTGFKDRSATLTLTAEDVIAISDNGTLRIEDAFGFGVLSVNSENQGWVLTGTTFIGDAGYEIYKVGQATLIVDDDLGGIIS